MVTLTRRSGVIHAKAALALTLLAAVGCSSGSDDPPRPLHVVTVAASGPGIVTSSPEGLACGHGGACASSFTEGTVATLTATPAPGWAFAGWTGGCSGTAACSLQVTSAAEVTATFVPLRLLTVTVSGGGSVTSSPPGLACAAGTCSAPFVAGTEVTLTATPATGWTFSSWDGACAGTGACTLSLSSPAAAVATFSPTSAGAVTFTGWVSYDFVPAIYEPATRVGTLSFAAAVEKPVRGAVVRVVRDATTVLATGTTDDYGWYSLTFYPGGAATVSLEALARTTAPAIQVEDNTDPGNAVWGFGITTATTTGQRDLHATHGWTGTAYAPGQRAAAPFAILDSMYAAAKGFLDAPRAVPFPPLRVNWSPDNSPSTPYDPATGAIVTSHFSSADGEIYILGKAGVDTDEFDAHVIVHEWGHFFEAKLSRADSPGGSHGLGDELDPRLAFGEGYGTALAAMLLPVPVYVDTQWAGSSIRAFGIAAETAYSDDLEPGPFSELSVLRLLYDVVDEGASEPWDALSVGLGPVYDVLVGPQRGTPALTTIGSFVAALRAHPEVDDALLDALLAHYAIGPISDAWGTGDPALEAVYLEVGALPYVGGAILRGGAPDGWNKRQGVQYWVVPGTGRAVTVRSQSAIDVSLAAYRAGTVVGYADRFLAGTETMTFPTIAGTLYVVVLTGYETRDVTYTPTLEVESP